MNLEEKISEIIEKEGSSIIVLCGFDTVDMPTDKKYFEFFIDYYDTLSWKVLNEEIVDTIFENRKSNFDYKWLTIEEFQLFKVNIALNKSKIIILKNNLYNKLYPYRQTLTNIDDIYHNLYLNDESELDAEELSVLENVSKIYGTIDFSKELHQYYVTYPEEEVDCVVYDYFESIPVNVNLSEQLPVDNVKLIDLFEDEIPFLDLTISILENRFIDFSIVFTLGTIDLLPYQYLERIKILSELKELKIYFTVPSIKRHSIVREAEYLKLLKSVFNYQEFKNISFYKSIEQKSKETVEISQVQIIDDIVTQVENAKNGLDFRDIFITASTGAGKSVMFQIPALYLVEKYVENKPLFLVISPLIGLMNDQVLAMKSKGINNSETIHGNISPYEKQSIIENVQKGLIDILYLSPESLQARGDITQLIGERSLGAVIIDEAHIVTTWGKSFRADYWYLGIYLTRLRKEYNFPIITFTATAIYGGREDMYLDTRVSLNMINPIAYFGKVRRDDIFMAVNHRKREFKESGGEYRQAKHLLALKHVQNAKKKNQKSLIYFPTVALLQEFSSFATRNDENLKDQIGKYHGSLSKEERDDVLDQFKNGDLKFVLATKAFGMGIDIPNINNVYHYAPTGNVIDYVQEIGRAARDNNIVQHGFGHIDFLEYDFKEVKQLYGMSTIRTSQLLEVMRKVLAIYKDKGNNRNLILSPEDFKHIFLQGNRDEDNLENKVKTALLMIEKDFSSPKKIGYSPFFARPRTLFGKDLIFVTPELEKQFIKSRLGKFFSKHANLESRVYSAVYSVNLSGIWERYYSSKSYPSFKYSLYTQAERETLQHKTIFNEFKFTSGVEVSFFNNQSKLDILADYKKVLSSFKSFVSKTKLTGTYFTTYDLGMHFSQTLKIGDRFSARSFAQAVINACFDYSKCESVSFINEKSVGVDKKNYKINYDTDIFERFILEELEECINPKNNFICDKNRVTTFYIRSRTDEIDKKIAALGIGEARKILGFQIIGGNMPQIYLRINSIFPLEKAIKSGDFYKNDILKDIQSKHYTSVEMLSYLFKKEQPETKASERIPNYTKWFWNEIENYFMGILPDEVVQNLEKMK